MFSFESEFFAAIVILLWTLSECTETADIANLADASPSLLVSHYDCTEPRNMRMFSTTEVADCEVQPEDMSSNKVRIRMYTKNLATKVDAHVCSVSYQHERWYCGMHSHSSIDAKSSSITTPLLITGAQCKSVIPTKEIPVTYLHYSGLHGKSAVTIDFRLDQFTTTVTTFGKAIKDTHNDCKGYGWVDRFSVVSYVQKVTVNYDNEAKIVVGINGLTLPCSYTSGECDSTGLGRLAYTCLYYTSASTSARPIHSMTRSA